jgi:secreted trypsin-like serine protease
VLKELDTRLDPPASCAGDSALHPDREWCVDNPGGTQGACIGDAGGPVIVDAAGVWRVVGHTSHSSRGTGCGDSPTIYANVLAPANRDWIE